jgi:hypothetical protein
MMIRKSLLVSAILICTVFFTNAQTFKKNTFGINVDAGLINTFGWGKVKIPPLTASLDYGLFRAGPGTISAGLILGYAKSYAKYKFVSSTANYYYTYNYVLAAFRGAFHICPGFNDQLDIYAGFMAGWNYVNSKFDSDFKFTGVRPAAEASHFLGGAFVGGRFFFVPKFGVNVELGYGISVVNIGASLKF